MTSKVKMIKKVIEDQLRLVEAPFVNDYPVLKGIIQQMIDGSKARKSIKLYQYLMEAFLYTGGSDQSNEGHYLKQKNKPTFNKIRKVLVSAERPKLILFQIFQDCGYLKNGPDLHQP